MNPRPRGREEPHGSLPYLGPLVLVPGIVEERDLRWSCALRKFLEALREGILRHPWQRAPGVYAGEGGGPSRELRSCYRVVERWDNSRERELPADMSCRLLAQGEAVLTARLVQDLGLHAGDVNAGGAFCLARLATDAEVHDLLHAPSRQLLGWEGAFDHGSEHVRPRPRGVLLVEGHHV